MKGVLSQVVAWAAMIATCIGVWLTFDNAPFTSEIMVYQGWCPSARTDVGTCQSGEEAGNPVTYKASQETQSVVYWFKDQVPSRLTGCAVRDAKNWSCQRGGGYATAMVDGRLSETSKLGVMFYQVPKYKWYWLWLHSIQL